MFAILTPVQKVKINSLSGRHRTEITYDSPTQSGMEIVNVQTIDNILARYFNEPIVKLMGKKHTGKLSKVIYNMVTCLGDQQPTTALALLIATLKKLHVDKSLSVFHLRLIMWLVFISTITSGFRIISWRIMRERGFYSINTPIEDHNPRLERHDPPTGDRFTLLGNHDTLSENHVTSVQSKDNRLSFWWRLRTRLPIAMRSFLTLTLFVLLSHTIWIYGLTQSFELNCPAFCYRDVSTKLRFVHLGLLIFPVSLSSLITYAQVVTIYPSYKLTTWARHLRMQRLYGGIRAQVDEEIERRSRIWAICIIKLESYFLSVFTSLWGVSFLFLSYVAFTFRHWGGKSRSAYADDIKDEMSMGFGQIVPLVLLIQPILQLLDSIKGTYRPCFTFIFLSLTHRTIPNVLIHHN